MSLVRPVENSAQPYANPSLYPIFPDSEVYMSDPRKQIYGGHSSQNHELVGSFHDSAGVSISSPSQVSSAPQSFTSSDSPDVFQDSHSSPNTFSHPSDSSLFIGSGNQSCLSNSLNVPNGAYGVKDMATEDSGTNEIRKKLEELERQLFDDSDSEYGIDQDMPLDENWTEVTVPTEDLVLSDSPKESCSGSNSSNVEIPTNSSPSAYNNSVETIPDPKMLLFSCASAISEGKLEESAKIINDLRQMVSIQGDPKQRLAAYMVEGLAARLSSSGRGLYKALRCKEPPSSDRLSAMQVLFEICPCFKFGFMAANGAIAEAFKDEERIHIIDFDVNQGSQYITLIQALSSRQPRKPTYMRITGIDDPESVQRTIGGLRVIGRRLEILAEQLGVPFEFRAIPAKTCDVTPNMLDLRRGEALIVNFAFQLHHMPDESVSTVNERDNLLRMVKSLGPKLVTVVEQDVNTNTSPFLARFSEVYEYYSAVFDSLDVTMSRESSERMNVEKHCLARDIVNIVACEGAERIERYEVAGKWRTRMMMAGFEPLPLSGYVNEAIRTLLRSSYCDRYKVVEEGGALFFGWKGKSLIVASIWR